MGPRPLRAPVNGCHLGGWGRTSFALVQVAVRSLCLAGSQGCFLTVPDPITKIDGETYGKREQKDEESRQGCQTRRELPG